MLNQNPKAMKNLLSVCLFFLLTFTICKSQVYYDTICWAWVYDEVYMACEGDHFSSVPELNAIFESNYVTYYERSFPFAQTPDLLKIHEIRCSSQGNIDSIITDLSNAFPGQFGQFSLFEFGVDTSFVYDPVDQMWVHYIEWLWHLTKIQADLAWDITRGDPNIKIAVIDAAPDIDHQDLETELLYDYDPFTLQDFNCQPEYDHGTAVASFASAETTETGNTPNGQLASIGFNTKIICYRVTMNRELFLKQALHASNVMGADVIISCGKAGISCTPDPSTGEELVLKEILNNGTVVVVPAGNGYDGHHCGSPPNNYLPFYPFHPAYDDRVIIVSSTDINDNHQFFYPDHEGTHSHFSEVDVCAPGYDIMGAKSSDCGNIGWPFNGSWGGTSFSSPIVAGLASLIKSVNPDLLPGEVQHIIKSTTDPITDANNYPGMVGTGRINAYQAVNLAANCETIEVSTNEVWSEDKVILCGVKILNGGILTIGSEVKLSQSSKIIVNRGGHLIIDGGTLTDLDYNSWPGIELQGKADEPQNSGNQGMVTIINDGTIENAVCGIKTHSSMEPIPGGPNFDYSGGIIIANEAKFINNHISVQMLPYQFESMSQFYKCEFKADNYFREEYPPRNFVKLTGIDGVVFKGNTFIDLRSNINLPTDLRAIGILAENSMFYADHICIDQSSPCNEYKKNFFKNLYYGIQANGTTLRETVTILNCKFEDNATAIHLMNIENASVNLNLFEKTNPFEGPLIDCFTGLYLDNCNGYIIEENIFTNLEDDEYNCKGIIVNESGEENNMIYNNSINSMQIGIQVQGHNKGVNTGLQLKCNDIRATNTDFVEYDVFIAPEGSEMGIAEEQGADGTTATVSANNQFNNKGAFGTDTDIRNESERIEYYWYPPNFEDPFKPEPTRYSNIERVWPTQFGLPWTPTNGCPSNITSGGSSGELRSMISTYTAKTDSVTSLMQSIEDGGNTDELNTDVETSTPDQSFEIYSQLINESPDLSDSVMVSSVKKENVLSNAMITEILAANPQAPKSDTVNQALDERINQLSEEQRADINQGLSQISGIERLHSLKHTYNSKRSYYLNSLLRLYKNDSMNSNISDSIISILQNEDRLYANYALAFEYLAKEDTTSVLNTLDSIEIVFNLNSGQTTQHELYQDYFGIYFDQLSDDETIYEIDSSQKADLYTMLNSATGKLKSLVRSLLIITDTLTYNEPVLQPDPNKLSEINIPDDQGYFNYKTKRLIVYPNPALHYFVIECTVPVIQPNTYLAVFDTKGTMIRNMEINTQFTRKIISTDEFSSGQYIVSLFVKDKIDESVKFNISR